MRGKDQRANVLFSYINMEARVPADHPLRPIREIARGTELRGLSAGNREEQPIIQPSAEEIQRLMEPLPRSLSLVRSVSS